jgi:hypothetical protein
MEGDNAALDGIDIFFQPVFSMRPSRNDLAISRMIFSVLISVPRRYVSTS